MIELYGLVIDSEISLPGHPTDRKTPEVIVRRGMPRRVPSRPAEGEWLGGMEGTGGRGFAYVRTPTGFSMRYYGYCEFEIDPTLGRVASFLDPRREPGWESIMLAGNLFSFILFQRGEYVLHASAVEIGGRVTAFVGPSGAGKSTIGAELCASGAKLVTDDVLRFWFPESCEGVRCYAGASELRLREDACRERPEASGWERSVDERRLVRPGAARGDLTIEKIVLPLLSGSAEKIGTERLRGSEATIALMGCPRLPGLPPRAEHLRQVAELCRRVPVYEVTMPRRRGSEWARVASTLSEFDVRD